MEEKKKKETNLEKLLSQAIPCSKIKFQTTVDAQDGNPEYNFFDADYLEDKNVRKSRRAKLFIGEFLTVIVQDGVSKIVPTAAVKEASPI